MRNLTSIQSADTVIADFSIEITATDASTTFVFSADNIVDIGQLMWEIPYGGGLGKTSSYNITLSSSADFIKENISKIVRGTTNLKVLANSDYFYPHVGRVRQFTRYAEDPNLFRLEIFDRFLDTVPYFPESLQDSYTTIHPETINANIGYPVYYGKHTRPFFHVPVDCSISSLLGPRGVSSENHVSSCWFIHDFKHGADETQKTTALMNKAWAQESTSTNLVSGGEPFEVKNVSLSDVRISEFSDQLLETISAVRQAEGYAESIGRAGYPIAFLKSKISVETVTYMTFQNTVATGTRTGNQTMQFILYGRSSESIAVDWTKTGGGTVVSAPPYYKTETFSWGDFTGTSTPAVNALSENYVGNIVLYGTIAGTGTSSLGLMSFDAAGTLLSEQYKNFSVFNNVVKESDIAVSENPIHILTHIFSEYTSTPFVQDQASLSQYDVNSYKFQCSFYYREPLSYIMHDFGMQTATNMWIGDSGQLNFKTYQQSNTIVNSNLIDFTITTSDIINMQIHDNPLGSSQFNSEKGRRCRVSYRYDFTQGDYNTAKEANPANDTYCQSAEAAGIEGEIFRQSRYIMDVNVASIYLGNIIRFHTQDESYVSMDLPAKFFQVEVADYIKVQHPAIVGSESLYQVVDVNMDLIRGNVKVRASQILNKD